MNVIVFVVRLALLSVHTARNFSGSMKEVQPAGCTCIRWVWILTSVNLLHFNFIKIFRGNWYSSLSIHICQPLLFLIFHCADIRISFWNILWNSVAHKIFYGHKFCTFICTICYWNKLWMNVVCAPPTILRGSWMILILVITAQS